MTLIYHMMWPYPPFHLQWCWLTIWYYHIHLQWPWLTIWVCSICSTIGTFSGTACVFCSVRMASMLPSQSINPSSFLAVVRATSRLSLSFLPFCPVRFLTSVHRLCTVLSQWCSVLCASWCARRTMSLPIRRQLCSDCSCARSSVSKRYHIHLTINNINSKH